LSEAPLTPGQSTPRQVWDVQANPSADAWLITDLGIMEPDDNGELTLTALHPGATVAQVKENTGWDIRVRDDLRTTEPPTEKELRILREELDPRGIYLKGGG